MRSCTHISGSPPSLTARFRCLRPPATQVIGFHMETSHKYYFNEDFSEKAVVAFSTGLAEGTIKPTYKSEEIPTGTAAVLH